MEQELYQYYSTQRPVDIGTYPKPADNRPVEIVNYDQRIPVENGAFQAWGALTYAAPLTAEQMAHYELRPSRTNLDVRRTMDAQAQVVGEWEKRNHIPEAKRLTWWYSDFGSYVPGDAVTPEQLAERYQFAKDFPNVRSRDEQQKQPPQHGAR